MATIVQMGNYLSVLNIRSVAKRRPFVSSILLQPFSKWLNPDTTQCGIFTVKFAELSYHVSLLWI